MQNQQQQAPLNERAAEDYKGIASFNLDAVHQQWPQFYHAFMDFLNETLAPGWQVRYTYEEVKTMFFFWFNGIFFGSSIYSESKKNLPKPERKQTIKGFEEKVDECDSYLEACRTGKKPTPADALRKAADPIIQALENVFGKGNVIATEHGKGIESLLSTLRTKFSQNPPVSKWQERLNKMKADLEAKQQPTEQATNTEKPL